MENTSLKFIPIVTDRSSRIESRPFFRADDAFSTEVRVEEKHLLTHPPAAKSGDDSATVNRRINHELLVNRLNLIHFQEGRIQVCFAHRQHDRTLLVPAFPQPCSGSELTCLWDDAIDVLPLIQTHEMKYILVPRGEKFIQSTPDVIEINEKGCLLKLPSMSRELSQRRVERQRCGDVSVLCVQNSCSFTGMLMDFTAASFRVELTAEPPVNFEWIDPSQPVQVLFHSGHQTFFSGECRIIRSTPGRSSRSYVLEPLKSEIQRFRKAEYRSQREILCPSPNLIFRHPLTHKRLELKVVDMSGSGFSVEEDERSASLMPGLIFPEAELHFAGIVKMTCTVQVVFRRVTDPDGKAGCVRCGLALIDIAAKDHVKLLGMLHQVKDKNAYVCNALDLEALWDFLFETGFIYPEKYALIATRRNEIKETYAKLYTCSPDIARHFVYQENGVILGHMATIRFWENAWLIHHHAARKSARNKAGLIVLEQFGRFGHDTHRIRRMHMDYLVCYYRPQNRFPSRIFGGVARHINDPNGCSLDLFAYLKRTETGTADQTLPQGWELSPAEAQDIDDLEQSYKTLSGGLMLKALDLEASTWTKEDLCTEFQIHGFKRERYLFSLRLNGRLKAMLIINISDVGLNLSDLTHCINALVLDPGSLSAEILLTSLSVAEKAVGHSNLSALLFPMSYVEGNAIPYDKAYYLWVFHLHTQSQTYFRYLSSLMKYV
jgi:hypothetical protein